MTKKSKSFLFIFVLYKRREVTYEQGLKFKEDFELDFYDEITKEKDLKKLFVFAAEILSKEYEKYHNNIFY